MTRRRLAVAPALLLGLSLALGCAAGQSASQEDAGPPPQADAQHDLGTEAATPPEDAAPDAATDGPAQNDAAQGDGQHDAAPQADAAHDTAPPQTDAQHDVGCPPGHTGVNCEDCVATLYKCDTQCVQSCASCTGKPATCSSPKECMTRCTTCSASCVDCPTGYHLCPSGCYVDGADSIATGCRLTCDSLPCAPPAHSTAVCASGVCDFTCDAAGHWIESGTACVCDSANGFVEDSGSCVCNASQNLKLCGGACVTTTAPANGCAGASCSACTTPAHGTAICDGSGNCDFTCDAAGHWVKSGSSCVCDTGTKDCSGTCADVTATATGCAGASCSACAAPAHGTAFCDGSGNCDFTCDTAGHWVKSGSSCVCDTGYTEAAGSCCLSSACPGTMYNGHCYWYVSTGATWANAEAACATQCAHLASIADANENSFVLGLAAADSWIGLKDNATVRQSISPDDCNSGAWIDSNGGTYTGSTSSSYDDYETCNSSSGYDVMFSINILSSGIWVFSTSQSTGMSDTVLGLYNRSSGSGYTGCIGSNLACDDDSGSGNRSLIVRNMAVGQYVVIVDGYSSSYYGSYQLDVRRFQWSDGSANTYNYWNSEEPNNSSTNEYCVEMYKSSNAGKWNDASCTTALGYVCERPF